jgi:hypothetical protein
VNANPNSWFYNTASDTLYVNSGTSIPSDPRQFTGVVQDDLVYSNYQSNIVFKNLVTDESAKYNAGYGFRVQGGANVSIINCEADRAGKHNFGVINSTGFVGNGITAQYAMPDQGVGGATALVSYSDGSVSNTTSSWSNVNVSNMGGYPAWYSHGDGLGPVSLTNFKTNGAVISMSANTTLTNATVINTGIQIYDDATVNGATLIGGGISLGANAVAKNIFIQDYVNSGTSYPSPIVVTGPNASLSLSTITISQTVQQWVALISMVGANSSLTMTGNVFDTGAQTYLGFQWATPVTPQNLISDYNLWTGSGISLASLQALGYDPDSITGNPLFVDAGNGNYALAPGSIGVYGLPDSLFDTDGLTDINGLSRPQGPGITYGAFEVAAVPEAGTSASLLVGLAVMGCRRRRS